MREVMMQEWVMKLKERWGQMTRREKQAVTLGGVVLAVFIVYAGIWLPFLNRVTAQRQRIVQSEKMLRWMQSADQQIQTLEKQSTSSHQAKSVEPVALLSALQKQINHTGLAQQLTGLKQATNDSIEMHFKKVGFDRLIKMLTQIVQTQNVLITQMTVVALDAPGAVNADIVLSF